MPKPKKGGGHMKQTTTQRGYGHDHHKRRQQLLYNHTDGDECAYCARPMYKNPNQNFDGGPLNADHAHQDKTVLAARLLHDRCNKQMSNTGSWVEHGPRWYQVHGQTAGALDWPGGVTITWHPPN